GQQWWQALPGGPTGYGNSPYQSLSSFAGNSLLISPAALVADGLLQHAECDGPFPSDVVDYDAVTSFKRQLIAKAWENFTSGARSDLLPAYQEFCETQSHWLEDYALFRALKDKCHGIHYLNWPAAVVRRDPNALTQARRELAMQIDQVCFAQFL